MISIPTLAPAYTSGRFNPNTLFTNPTSNPGGGSGPTEDPDLGLWYDPSDLTAEKVAWRRNLLTYTSDFTTSLWSSTSVGLTVSSSQVLAPSSAEQTASLLTFNTSSTAGLISASQTVVANVIYTGSIYLQRGNTDWAMVTLSTASQGVRAAVWVNLSTGEIGTQNAAGTGMAITGANVSPTGDGWYRVSVSGYHTSNILRLNVYLVTGDAVTTRSTNGTVYAYGPQFERRTYASSYQALTDFYTEFRNAFPNHTLYQDATSWPLLPVTNLGEPVGLALTRPTPGPLVGGELISNPSFSSGTTGWVAGANTTVSTFTATNGIATLTVVSPDTSPRFVFAITGLRVNQLYKLQLVRAEGDTGTGTRTLTWTSGSTGTGGSSFTNPAVGTTDRLVLSSASTMYVALAISSASAGATFNVDSVSLRELQGDNAFTQTTGYRPFLDARENLFTNTEQANDSDWKKTNVTVNTAPTLAPDGNYTADLVVETTTTGAHSLYFNTASVITGVYYTYSVYVKKGTGASAPDWIQLQFSTAGFGSGDNYRANFNVTTGALGSYGSAIVAVGATSELNGYFRLRITAQATATSAVAGATVTFINNDQNAAAAPSYAGATNRDLFVWGQQLNIGMTAKTYQRVVDAYDYADIDAPRGFLFDGVDANLSTPNLDWTTSEFSVFIGERRVSTGEGSFGTYFDRNGHRAVTAANTPNNALRAYVDYASTDLNVVSTANSVALGAHNIISVVWNGDFLTSSMTLRCNGTTLTNDAASTAGSGAIASDANTSIRIGNRYLLDRTFNGVINQIMLRNTVTDEPQVQALENFIAQKIGVTL